MGPSPSRGEREPPFELTKWYLDCVAENGDALIVYSAALRWRALAARYASTLESSEGRVRQAFTLRGCAPPTVSNDSIRWSSRALRASGEWRALASPLAETVFASDAGAIHLECLQPKSAASVRADGVERRGLGYCERLRMTIPPWRLPIDELRWGRFLSESDSLVWIDWRGPANRQFVFHNGVAVAAERISEVRFEDARVLRQGRLGETVLGTFGKRVRLLPGRILGVEETKWLSRAILERPGAPASPGWAIHEVVRWPR